MKIGFALQKQNDTKIAESFHGNKWIGIYNLENESIEQYAVYELKTKFHKDNIISIFSKIGVGMVVCDKIQPLALKIFNEKNILVYKSQSELINCNIETLKKGRLKIYNKQMIQKITCGSSCNSCSSSTCG